MHPSLLHLGHLILPTYGLLAAAGLMAALTLSLRTAVTVGLSPDRLWNAGLAIVVAAFVLSRLLLIASNLHSFLQYPILLLTVPSLTAVGLLLSAIAAILYLRLKHLPLRSALDAWAPCATLLWAFLALGHFAEGSDPGLPTPLPTALPIPPDPTRLHPVSLYATLCALAITVLLLHILPRTPTAERPALSSPQPEPGVDLLQPPNPPGTTAALALVLTGLAQFLLTFLREPAPPSSPLLGNLLDPLQWVALGLIAAGALLYISPSRSLPHAL